MWGRLTACVSLAPVRNTYLYTPLISCIAAAHAARFLSRRYP